MRDQIAAEVDWSHRFSRTWSPIYELSVSFQVRHHSGALPWIRICSGCPSWGRRRNCCVLLTCQLLMAGRLARRTRPPRLAIYFQKRHNTPLRVLGGERENRVGRPHGQVPKWLLSAFAENAIALDHFLISDMKNANFLRFWLRTRRPDKKRCDPIEVTGLVEAVGSVSNKELGIDWLCRSPGRVLLNETSWSWVDADINIIIEHGDGIPISEITSANILKEENLNIFLYQA